MYQIFDGLNFNFNEDLSIHICNIINNPQALNSLILLHKKLKKGLVLNKLYKIIMDTWGVFIKKFESSDFNIIYFFGLDALSINDEFNLKISSNELVRKVSLLTELLLSFGQNEDAKLVEMKLKYLSNPISGIAIIQNNFPLMTNIIDQSHSLLIYFYLKLDLKDLSFDNYEKERGKALTTFLEKQPMDINKLYKMFSILNIINNSESFMNMNTFDKNQNQNLNKQLFDYQILKNQISNIFNKEIAKKEYEEFCVALKMNDLI